MKAWLEKWTTLSYRKKANRDKIMRLVIWLASFIFSIKICSFRCVDNIVEYATMGLWRASVSCLFCISNLAKYHIRVKVEDRLIFKNF